MKKIAMLVLLIGGSGVVAVAAQRIFTNPNQDVHLKQLFPAAAAFSSLSGEPLHYTAYATDPRANPSAAPIGYAYWTTDLVPQEHGYHGPIYMLVGLDLTGVLTGVIVDYDSEPYGYFSVEPQRFGAQFKGKHIRDAFRVGGDVDAVSRASISITSAARAIRESSRMVAKVLLPSDAVK